MQPIFGNNALRSLPDTVTFHTPGLTESVGLILATIREGAHGDDMTRQSVAFTTLQLIECLQVIDVERHEDALRKLNAEQREVDAMRLMELMS
jgi:hypothetical protein